MIGPGAPLIKKYKKLIITFLPLVWLIVGVSRAIASAEISGESGVWHPLVFTFLNPKASEPEGSFNPSLDCRLQVTFTGPGGQTYEVPGFFNGYEEKSNSSIWQVYFTPDEAGHWSFKTAFRQGTNLAVSLNPDEGNPISFDGTQGTFEVANSPPDAPGFLGKGRLVYVNDFYLKTLGDRKYWLKGGTDSPENFLGYKGFVNTTGRPDKDWFHEFDRHIQDWKPGDPDWENGQGRGIIGALNYLASKQVNSIYLILNNIGGDGQDVWPYSGNIDRKGSVANDNKHFDIEKLKQWEILFSHAQRKGINLNLLFCEGERANKQELDHPNESTTQIGVERKLFTREMIARFGHHNGLQWMLCEEYDHPELKLNSNFIKNWAQYIKAIDPYDHPLSVHNCQENAWEPFFGQKNFDLTSYQYHPEEPDYGEKVEELRKKANDSGRKIAIHIDEPYSASVNNNEEIREIPHQGWTQTVYGQKLIRKAVIYPIFFSGGSLELILEKTLATENFRLFDNLWNYLFYARRFMEKNLPFWEMKPRDDLLVNETAKGQVLAKIGKVYAIYLPKGAFSGRLNLEEVLGEFKKSWYNPRTGKFEGPITTAVGGGYLELGPPPSEPLEDWVILLKRQGEDFFFLFNNWGANESLGLIDFNKDGKANGVDFGQVLIDYL